MGTVLLRFLVGGLAGFLTWALMEPFVPPISDASYGSWELTFVALLGAAIGVAVGGFDGFARGGKIHLLRGIGFGLLFGSIGSCLGLQMGSALCALFFHSGPDAVVAPLKVFARALAFLPIGICLGAAIGASSLTTKRIIQGAIGGGLGALVSGLAFDLIGGAIGPMLLTARGVHSGEVGGPSRAITAVLLGALIGLFIGLVERISRSAWVRLHLGRNEGKEWSIDSAQTFIGRNETIQIPLFGDPNVAPIHASIQKQAGNQYVLIDGGSPFGTFLNGQRIQQALLFHGAQIGIGGFRLEFLMKNQAAPARGPEAYAQPYPMQGQPMQPQPVPYAPVAQVPAQAPMQTAAYPAQPYQQPMTQQPYQQPMPTGTQTMAYGAPLQPVAMQPQPAAMPSGFAVIVLDGPLVGQRFPVSTPVEIGRETAGIRIATDPAASRRHASFAPAPTGVAVADLGSTNGTYLNNQRIQQGLAAPGDIIKVGSTSFRVEAS